MNVTEIGSLSTLDGSTLCSQDSVIKVLLNVTMVIQGESKKKLYTFNEL